MKSIFFIILSVLPLIFAKQNVDECKICSTFFKDTLYTLKMIVEGGVFGGCTVGCKKLAPKYFAYCDFICSAIGEAAFIELIKKADLDPYFVCQSLHLCPIGPDCKVPSGCGRFKQTNLSPHKCDPTGCKQEVLTISFSITQEIGPSSIFMHLDWPQGSSALPIEDTHLIPDGLKVGNYSYVQEFTVPDRRELIEGDAIVKMELCYGWCDSKHAHSQKFDTKTDSFEIINCET